MPLPRRIPLLLSLALIAGLAGCLGPRPVADQWPNGTPRRHGLTDQGKLTGHWVYWYADGTKQAEGDWAQDKLAGTWSWWRPDGSLQHHGAYVQGKRSGPWQHCHPGGQVASQGAYVQDRQDGLWLYRDPSQAEAARGWFGLGVREGLWLISGPQGRLDLGLYLDGQAVGPWLTWNGDRATVAMQRLPTGALFTWDSDHRGGRIAGPGVEARIAWTAEGTASFRILRDGAERTGSLTIPKNLPETPAPAVPPATLPVQVPPTVSVTPAPVAAAPVAAAQVPVVSPPPETVAVSPVPIPPEVLTPQERKAAAGVVRTFTHGRDLLADNSLAWEASGRSGGLPESKALVGRALPQLRFLTSSGTVVDLEESTKPTVVVLMRGFSGQVCLYCASQTTAIADNMARFQAVGADVLVIYPGPTESVPAFVAAIQTLRTDPPPMPIGLDVSLLLVRGLGVEDNLAKPTSLVILPGGRIGYAYIGASIADRPSVDTLINAVKRLGK